MSISGVSGQATALSALSSAPTANSAGNTAALTDLIGGADDGALIANLAVASSGVSTALQTLGSIIDITA